MRFLLARSSVRSIIVSAVTRDHAEGLQFHVLPTDDPYVRSTFCVKPLGCNRFPMSTMTRAAMIVVGSADILVPCCAVGHLVARSYALPTPSSGRQLESQSRQEWSK